MSPRVASTIVLTTFGATAVGLTVGVIILARPVTTGVVVILGVCAAAAALTVAYVLGRERRRHAHGAGAKREDGRLIWVVFLGVFAVPLLELADRLTKLAVVSVADALMLGLLALMVIRWRRRA